MRHPISIDGTNINELFSECQCNNHSSSCYWDRRVANLSLSMNAAGEMKGGGVCEGCTNNTDGLYPGGGGRPNYGCH